MLLASLMVVAVALTCTMFATRQAMLGFACAIFWAVAGAEAYTLSTTPWGDIYFYIFIGSTLGMTVFTMLAAFGLREKRDTLGDVSMEKESDKYIDETQKDEPEEKEDDPFSVEAKNPKPSSRLKGVKQRAAQRRAR